MHNFSQSSGFNGLGWTNLVFSIDYSKDNLKKGKKTFCGKSLHNLETWVENPYQKVVKFLGETLEPFNNNTNGKFIGYRELLITYKIQKKKKLKDTMSYSTIVKDCISSMKSNCFRVLVIITCQQNFIRNFEFSEAVSNASEKHPLAIIVVGVGDGPWDKELEYVNYEGRFDNFTFVNYNKIVKIAKKLGVKPDIIFAFKALREIPNQFKCIKLLNLV